MWATTGTIRVARALLSPSLQTFCPTYILNYLFAACGCLSVGLSIALSIAVSVSGNCVVLISLQYVCALCPRVHTPQLSYCRLFSVSLLLLLAMTPCHVTQFGHSSINFEFPQKTCALICAVGAYAISRGREVLVCVIVPLPVEPSNRLVFTPLFNFISLSMTCPVPFAFMTCNS